MCAWGPLALRAATKKSAQNKPAQKKHCRCRLNHPERLENRLLMTATPSSAGNDPWLNSGLVCSCPLCTGIGLEQLPAAEEVSGSTSAAVPLAQLPQLSSRPGAAAKLYLDFNGNYESTWGSWSNVSTPVYDQDGDATTFSDGELASIYEIWARVSEDFAPFNIDVTTIDPGSKANKVVAHLAIGGSSSDWYGAGAGGVAYVGGFYNSASNVGYVFENNLGNGHAKYVAECVSHEAGHLFGLQHQSSYSGTTKTEEYNSGNGSWAPIMGVGYYAPRTTWHNGANTSGSTSYQDDLSILVNSNNGFGYRADDFGSTRGTASALTVSGNSVNVSGLIGRFDDVDVWSFATGGGNVSFQLTVAAYGANLDSVLEIWDSNGTVIASSSPSDSQSANLSASLGSGTYYVVAKGLGDYGNMGQYTLSGTLPSVVVVTNPEIQLSISGSNLESGGTLGFGSTNVGTAVTRVVTVTNLGNGPLTLSSLAGAALPLGFVLASDLGQTTLSAGQSTTFTLQLSAASAGSFSGVLTLVNSDADEGQFAIALSGTVVALNPEIQLSVSGSNLESGGVLSFGSTTVGTAITRVVTVTNQGNGPLTLNSLAGTSLPPGFALAADLGKTTLNAGESTTFTLQMTAAGAGTFSGTLVLVNSDADEGQFALGLSGAASAAEEPVVKIADDGDAGYSRTGSWQRVTGKGYGSDISSSPRGNGSYVSSWSFYSLPAGQYRIFATWTAGSKNATNAPYTILDGGTTRATIRVSQRTAPGDLIAEGARWKRLTTVTVSSGQLVVRLTNSANGQVMADAIRIEKVPSAGATTRALLTSAAPPAQTNANSAPSAAVSAALTGFLTANQQESNPEFTSNQDVAAELQALEDALGLIAEARRATSRHTAEDGAAVNDRALGSFLSSLI